MGFETAKVITEQGLEGLQRYYGTYRAIVVNNIDEEKHMNRLKVMVPEVMSGIMTWALPKGQHGSTQTGFKYLAPKIGDIVFVTFEFGDPTKPLWEYHGWGIEQIPSPLDGPNKCGIVTPEGNVIVIDDDSGTLNLYFNGDVIVSNKGNSIVHSERDVNAEVNPNNPLAAQGNNWEYVVTNGLLVADDYATKNNPSAVFSLKNPDVSLIKQYGGKYEGEYLLTIVNDNDGDTSYAQLLPLFDINESSDSLEDELNNDTPLWEVIIAKHNGKEF